MRGYALALGLALLNAAAIAADPPPTADGGKGNGRIIGGKPAPAHSVPWQAEIFYYHPEAHYPAVEEHACGAALIAPDWILTASHCQEDPGKTAVRLGTQNLSLPGQVFMIDHSYPFPRPAGWVHSTGNHSGDIMLVHIMRAQNAPSTQDIRTIPLADPAVDTLHDKQPVSVTGWGSTKPREADEDIARAVIAPELQQALLNVLPLESCDPDINQGMTRRINRVVLGDRMMCAAALNADGTPNAKVDTCQGDSGGPLVRQNEQTRKFVLVGIVTFGEGCGATRGFHPGYFTKVAPYNDWIRRQMASPGKAVTGS